jgi:hypothetical protein
MTKKPKYMRPAREMPDIDMDWLLSRCTQETEEEGGCLIWRRQMNHGPVTTIDGRIWRVRHLVWLMAHKCKPKRSFTPMPTECADERCVHPDHLTLVKRNSHLIGQPMPALQRLRVTQAKRASAKLTEKQAHAIRDSDETLQVLAQRYNISISLVHRIKTGQAWTDHRNPFFQLTTRYTPTQNEA